MTRNDTEVKPDVERRAPGDPGAYTLRARAPGKKPWSLSLGNPDPRRRQTVTVPPLDDDPRARKPEAPPTTTVVAPPAIARADDKPPPPPLPVEPPGQAQRTAGIVVGSLGLAGLVVGGVLGGLAASRFSDAKSLCPSTPCSNQDGIARASDAE